MTKSKYDNYFYFRTVADEDDDDDSAASAMVPVNKIQGIGAASTTSIQIFYDSPRNESVASSVILNINAGKMKKVIHSLISAVNKGPHSDGVTVIADDVTTDFDGTLRNAVYLDPDITSCGAITVT